MIDITRWGKAYYYPSNKIDIFFHLHVLYSDLDRVLDLSVELLNSSLDLSTTERILLTFWLNIMDRKKKNNYIPRWWLFIKIGRHFYTTITEIHNILDRNKAIKILNFVEASVTNEKIPCSYTLERPYAIFALAFIIWYFPNYLTKKERQIYSNFSFEEMYNFVTGDNNLRGITINDKDLLVDGNPY